MAADSTGPRETAATEALQWAVRELEGAGIPTAVGDAEIIVAHALGLRRADVQEGGAEGRYLDHDQHSLVVDFVGRRKKREPLQHLTGTSLFRNLQLAVGPGVFVPRRETEFVTQLAVDALRASDSPSPIGVDLGTGAGAIALSMATEVPNSTVIGVELFPEAFEWTKRNFETIAPGNARAVLGDMADALPELDGRVDVVAGNPPFQPDGVEAVTPEVRLFDPPGAVRGGGSDGLDLVRALSKTARRLLRPGGTLAFEHGISQAPAIAALLQHDGWNDVTSHTDPRGRERVTTARR
ncbi:peptide chain release factor N(5)-glutamine methyltransferase [soil metagenome]